MTTTNQNEAQVIARIEDLKGDLGLNYKQICECLVLLKSHYMHRDPLFRSYRDVASGAIIPEAVMCMAAKRGYLDHIAGRPRDLQRKIASDGEFDWCTVVRGEIVEKRTGWKKMGAADFKRMFPIGGPVRSMSEQRAALAQEMASAPVTHIRREPVARVNVEAQTFTLGTQTVPLSIVLAALHGVAPAANVHSILTMPQQSVR